MKIKKLGHCCLVIEVKGKRILTDPGSYSTMQDEEKNIDLILITHEHPDHFHIDSLKKVLANNPEAAIVTNTAVGKLLEKEGITYEVLEGGQSKTWFDILFEGFGEKHAEIYKTLPSVQNTGFFIDDTLFYPGDAFTIPGKSVDILALPVAGPWLKISEAIDYALAIKPRVAFPVHDGIYKDPSLGSFAAGKILPEQGVQFIELNKGDEKEF